jgi:hypothetical protein
MRRALQVLLALFGATDIFIATLHVVLGPKCIPGSIPVNATMDSEDRFYATPEVSPQFFSRSKSMLCDTAVLRYFCCLKNSIKQRSEFFEVVRSEREASEARKHGLCAVIQSGFY